MLTQGGTEEEILRRERQFHELSTTLENLEEKTADLLHEVGVTLEQVRCFLDNAENFTEENWDSVQKQRQEHEDRLNMLLANVPNPKQTAKRQRERQVQPHWLFVR